MQVYTVLAEEVQALAVEMCHLDMYTLTTDDLQNIQVKLTVLFLRTWCSRFYIKFYIFVFEIVGKV